MDYIIYNNKCMQCDRTFSDTAYRLCILSDSTRNFICKTLYRMLGTEQVLMKSVLPCHLCFLFPNQRKLKDQNYF